MRRDLLLAMVLCLFIVAAGYFLTYSPANDRYDADALKLGTAQHRIALDQQYITDYPKLERDQNKRIASLSTIQMTASDGQIEQTFLTSFDRIVRRNRIGIRPITIDPSFTPLAAPAAVPVAQAPSVPAANQAAASASSAGALFDGTTASDTVPKPAVARPSKLFRAKVQLQMVGTYAATLETISELSSIQVLSEINGVTLNRESDSDGSKNPNLTTSIALSLYRVVKQ